MRWRQVDVSEPEPRVGEAPELSLEEIGGRRGGLRSRELDPALKLVPLVPRHGSDAMPDESVAVENRVRAATGRQGKHDDTAGLSESLEVFDRRIAGVDLFRWRRESEVTSFDGP